MTAIKCYRCAEWPCQCADGCAVVCADCREVIAEVAAMVGAVVTDPPYGLGDIMKKNRTKDCSWTQGDWHGGLAWDGTIAEEGVQAVVDLNVPTCIWGGNNYSLPPNRGWFVWDKKQPDTWSSGQCELAWTNISRPNRVYRMAQCEAHDEMRKSGGKKHPTQKPVSLMAWCIRMMRLGEGVTIFDPFIGSGSSLIAAKRTGHPAIGIEREEKYCEIAAKRLANEPMPLIKEAV